MQIINDKPPMYEEANKLFRLDELKLGTIFAYGDTIYNPFKVELTQDLLVHEMVHSDQQGHNATVAKLWWMLFLGDPEFRVSQEVEAYAAQWSFLCAMTKDRERRAKFLYSFGSMLSGPMYGSVISRTEAMKRIREKAGK